MISPALDEQLTRIAKAFANKVEAEHPEKTKDYDPMFHLFTGGAGHYAIRGWKDGGVAPGIATYGKQFCLFVNRAPKYGTYEWMDELIGWCVCLEALPDEAEVLPGSSQKAASTTETGGPKKSPPAKKNAATTQPEAPASKPLDDDDMPGAEPPMAGKPDDDCPF